MATEPSVSWQQEQHQRIVDKDPTAFAELCEIALPYLVEFLQNIFPNVESHIQEMVVIDFLLAYQAKPQQYDPDQLSLLAYFKMAVRNDTLNAIDKQNRHEKRLVSIDTPAVQESLPPQDLLTESGQLEEWLQEHTQLSRQEIINRLATELAPEDEQILLLMLEGERDSQKYASVMGVSHLEPNQQRLEVKRAKDRLVKKLSRFGDRLN